MLGIPGLVEAYRAGNVTLANAIGNGVADDKAIYPAVPEIIRFYLAEEPILPQVPTFLCRKDEDRSYVLSHLTEMVVKEVSGSGGYGMLVGPKASRAEVARMREAIQSNPRGFIAQPVVELSSCPAWVDKRLVPRRVDLRPYVITGSSDLGASRRAHARRAARRVVRRQLEPGRRIEGHLGAASLVGGRRAGGRRRRARGRWLR